MRKWARRHKRTTHLRIQRTSTIIPGMVHIGPVVEEDTKTPQKKSGILNTFRGSVPEVGAVLGTKDKNYKESFQNLQECVLNYVVENYKKGVDLAPLINKL